MADPASVAVSSNVYMEQEVRTRGKALADQLNADVIAYIGPIFTPFDDEIRERIDAINPKRGRLCVVLQTEGGSIETTERIANVFRHSLHSVIA
jgi:hypothetical protein